MVTASVPFYFTAKQPAECGWFACFDFTDAIETGETIVSAVATAINVATGASVTANFIDATKQNITTPKVNVWLKAWGTDGDEYKVTCRATSNNGAVYEGDGIVPILAE